jgi:hypothetical protein
MWLFGKKKRDAELAAKEAEIQAIHQRTLDKIQTTADKTDRVNKLLKDNKGVTELWFLATGGDRRMK